MTSGGSLQRQWLGGVGAIALVAMLLSTILVLQHARRSVVMETQAGAALVAEWLSAWPAMASKAEAIHAVEGLRSAVRGTRHLCDVVVVGRPTVDCVSTADVAAPAWFVRRLALPSELGAQRVDIATAQGPLAVTVLADTRHEIEEVWRESRGVIAFIAALALGVLLLASQLFRRSRLVLRDLASEVRRIALGDYCGRAVFQGVPRELLPLVEATIALRRSLDATTAENRQLARQCMEAQERERHEVARELHDEVGQHLAAAEAQLAVAARASDPGRRAAATEQVRGNLRAIFGTVHGLLGRLRPAAIDSVGLLGALEQLACDWRAQGNGIALTLTLEGDDRRLEGRVAIHAYRVAQEALTNIARHARGADRALLHCRCEAHGAIELAVCDDGPGLPTRPGDGAGFGLRGMRERAASIDATLEVSTSETWAMQIRLVRLPQSSGAVPSKATLEVVPCG